jgi:hypothetical protein
MDATRSLTLTDEHRLRVLENKVLRRVFGTKREEVPTFLINLLNEEFQSLYSPPNIIRVFKFGRVRCSTYRRDEKFIQNFVGKT